VRIARIPSLLRHPGEIRVALDGLDRLLQEKYPAGKGLKSLGGEIPCVNLVRYADDFTVAHTATDLGNTAMLRKRRPWVGWTAPLAGWGSILVALRAKMICEWRPSWEKFWTLLDLLKKQKGAAVSQQPLVN
jgi:hypothetical protein